MTPPDEPPATTTPREVTPGDVASIGAAAGEAAREEVQRGATPEEVRAAVEAAMQAQVEKLNVRLSDDDVQRIAQAQVAELERRGAFDPPPSPGGEPPATPPAAPESSAGAAPAGSPAAPAPATPTVAPDNPPRPTTFADRFLGTGR